MHAITDGRVVASSGFCQVFQVCHRVHNTTTFCRPDAPWPWNRLALLSPRHVSFSICNSRTDILLFCFCYSNNLILILAGQSVHALAPVEQLSGSMVNGPRIILSGQGMLKVYWDWRSAASQSGGPWVSGRQLRPCGGRTRLTVYSGCGSWAPPSYPDRISKGLVKEHAFPQKNVDLLPQPHNHTTTTHARTRRLSHSSTGRSITIDRGQLRPATIRGRLDGFTAHLLIFRHAITSLVSSLRQSCAPSSPS